MLGLLRKKNIDKVSSGFAAALAIPFGKRIEKATSELINEGPTAYDQNIDANYILTHIGGANHRLFDGSHSPTDMWQKVKETFPDDTKAQEIYNYLLSMVKDLQTVKGIPLFSINDKASYDKAAEFMSQNYNVNKSWISDSLTINLTEFLATSLGMLAFIFKWNKREKDEFADLASSLATAGLIGGNPLLLVISLISLGSSFTKNKNKMKWSKSSLRGILGMTSFVLAASMFASPLIGLIAGIIVSITVKRVTKNIPKKDILNWTKSTYEKNKRLILAATGVIGLSAITGI